MTVTTLIQNVAGAIAKLVALAVTMDNAVVSLFKGGFIPDGNTTKAEFEAEECDYSGYATTTITDFTLPGIDGSGVPSMTSNGLFYQNDDGTVENAVGGGWIETAAGVVRYYWIFPSPVTMAAPLQSMNLNVLLKENGPSVVTDDMN